MEPETANPQPLNIIDAFRAKEATRMQRNSYPVMRDSVATVSVALTAIILSFSVLLPVMPILVLYALWFSQPVHKGASLLRLTWPCVWIVLLPMLEMLSTLWSDYPLKSLYLGTETLSMMVCVIIIARVVRFRAFADGLSVGIAIALSITLASGIHGTDYMSSTYSLIGYFGSKNIVGQLSAIGLLSSGITFFMRGSWSRKIMLSAIPFALCTICLERSKSATSTLAAMIAFAAMVWMIAIIYLPKTLKRAALVGTILFVLVAASAWFAARGGEAVLNAFGKDSTLTGRTYLWHEGYKIGVERPILGHGYSAFWVPGQPQAERYWYEFQMIGHNGFHFHNMYIQVFVDLGIIGVALIALQILMTCYVALRAGLAGGSPAEVVFWTGLVFMFFVRSFAEVDFFTPYAFGTLLIGMAPLRFIELQPRSSRLSTITM